MLQIKMRHDKDRNKADNNPRESSQCSVTPERSARFALPNATHHTSKNALQLEIWLILRVKI